jgi:signal transduction histidine kinase
MAEVSFGLGKLNRVAYSQHSPKYYIWEHRILNGNSMSMLMCPLCGKSTSVGRFDPSAFDDDIYVQTVRGLGRGRGFEVVSKSSILEDDAVIPLITDRILDITRMLLRCGRLNPAEVLSRLDLQTTAPNERNEVEALEVRLEETSRDKEKWRLAYQSLAAQRNSSKEVEVLKAKVQDYSRETNRWRNEAEALETRIEEMESKHSSEINSINSRIEDITDSIDDILKLEKNDADSESVDDTDPLDTLEEFVNLLINEYEALAAEVEE